MYMLIHMYRHVHVHTKVATYNIHTEVHSYMQGRTLSSGFRQDPEREVKLLHSLGDAYLLKVLK